MNLVPENIFEAIKHLKPRSKEEIEKKLIKFNIVDNPNILGNTHTNRIAKLIEKGYDIRINFNNEIVEYIYEKLQDLMIPFLFNDGLEDINNTSAYFRAQDKHLNKDTIYIVNGLMPTLGRHDINSSITWQMTDEEIKIAKNLYKGKNNIEYPFFFKKSEIQIVFIISKSEKWVTLVLEGQVPQKYKNLLHKQGFKQISPAYADWYLGKWKKPEEIVDFVKKLSL